MITKRAYTALRISGGRAKNRIVPDDPPPSDGDVLVSITTLDSALVMVHTSIDNEIITRELDLRSFDITDMGGDECLIGMLKASPLVAAERACLAGLWIWGTSCFCLP